MDIAGELKHPFKSLTDRVRAYRERMRQIKMFDSLGESEKAELAADIGVSVYELGDLMASKHTAAAELLNRMLAVYGLDHRDVVPDDRAAMREIELMCSRCENTRRCRHELDAGTALEHAAEFCPNAEVMQKLAKTHGDTVRA
jgi:transcriptional regulator with XRE-family HTH domain